MKKIKSTLAILSAAVITAAAFPFPVQAESAGLSDKVGTEYTGFVQDTNGKTYFLDNGVIVKDKEVFDTESNAWYWFDTDGIMAADKDIFVTINQERTEGKWVRYSESGGMIKGEDYRYGGWYYFEPVTGTMMKGPVILEDGRKVFYDTVTGQMVKGEYTYNGQTYIFDENDGHLISGNESLFWIYADGKNYWYENWQRQGWEPLNSAYRGKEIYDPASDAWYWLDNVLQGAKAVKKDVYQESSGGKWVRYDAEGGMIKGWNEQNGNRYYFDLITGAMAKGNVVIDGVSCYFDENTGILQYIGNGEEHEHNFTWEVSGNTRTMKCSCGVTRGFTETCYNGYWGYYDSAMTTELFNETNRMRQQAQYVDRDAIGNVIYAGNVHAVSRDSSLDALAASRAVEVLSSWSHNGITSYYTTEVLAKGYNTMFDVECAWAASHDHAATITYQYYTRAGASWFWYDQDGTGENLIGVAVMEYGGDAWAWDSEIEW